MNRSLTLFGILCMILCGLASISQSSILSDISHIQYTNVSVAYATGAPLANNDIYSINQGISTSISVLNNDFASDGISQTNLVICAGSVSSITADIGTLSIQDTSIVFTPAPDFYGELSFVYSACDEFGNQSASATVTITVVQKPLIPPLARNDIISISLPSSTILPLIANDSDEDGTIIADNVSILAQPQLGTVTFMNGNWYYNPNTDAIKNAARTIFTQRTMQDVSIPLTDTFSYKITDSDGLDSNTANVTLQLSYDNGAPQLTPQTITIDRNETALFDAFQISDTDNDTPFTTEVLQFSEGVASCEIRENRLSCILENANPRSQYTVTVRATDSFGLSNTQVFTIIVNDTVEQQSSLSSVATSSYTSQSSFSSMQVSQYTVADTPRDTLVRSGALYISLTASMSLLCLLWFVRKIV